MKPPSKKTSSPVTPSALQLSHCLAKTFSPSFDKTIPGRNIFNHCQIVGRIAKAILSRMPDDLRQHLFPKGSELIAAAHDLGKVSPYFQEKIYRGTSEYRNNSLPELSEIKDPELEKEWGGHAGVSLATVKDIDAGKFIPEIVGSHHGFTPGSRPADDSKFGGEPWQTRREELADQLKQYFDCDWPKVSGNEQGKVLAGLTTVSDWIGSGSYFENPDSPWEPVIETALDNAGFVKPLLKPGLSFKTLFGFSPYDTQNKLIETVSKPGVYILEAPMGSGKTEAALYAAYLAMTQRDATGIYFALPTQITSERIFSRVNQFLESILDPACPDRALLLHSNAWLKETEIGKEGRPGKSWFSSAKRKTLAPFGVGTIDQALMAVMNVKHGFVRAFGLAGKVVILDEVHSYDSYTGTLLDELVRTLRELYCTVIILSATLTLDRRAELMGTVPASRDYPLVSAVPNEGSLEEVSTLPLPDKSIKLIHQDESFAESEALKRAEQGQLVLWIENTVGEAQDIYSRLAARAREINLPCGLLHSRFLNTDRNRLEKHWIELFEVKTRSREGCILVGTQVLEQSLDIDADFLVVRFCPTDMLLQRLGRLWRHPTAFRLQEARREVCILHPALAQAIENPEQAFGKTAFVYNPYLLVRGLEVWHNKNAIILPGDIRSLIEGTYEEREELGRMAQLKRELYEGNKDRIGVNAMRNFARIGLSRVGATLSDDKATTRYSQQETVLVLLLSKFKTLQNENVQLEFLDGEKVLLPKNIKYNDRERWQELAVRITQHTVQVPVYQAPKAIRRDNLKWLKDYLYLGSRYTEDSLVRIAKVKGDAMLTTLEGGSVSENYHLQYNGSIGYIAQKIKEVNR